MKSKTRPLSNNPLGVLVAVALAGSLSHCGSASEDKASVSFEAEIAPILVERCVLCHHTGSAIGYDLSKPFDPETGVVGRINSWTVHDSLEEFVVDPGDPSNSSLVNKVREEDLDLAVDGNPMPYQIPSLSDKEIEKVETWILEGAMDDEFFAAEVAPLFGTELTLRRQSGKCTFCHYPGSPTGLSVLDVFDAREGMVNVPSAAGGFIVSPGKPEESALLIRLRGDDAGPRMPKHFERLSSDEVTLIENWISEGALNN